LTAYEEILLAQRFDTEARPKTWGSETTFLFNAYSSKFAEVATVIDAQFHTYVKEEDAYTLDWRIIVTPMAPEVFTARDDRMRELMDDHDYLDRYDDFCQPLWKHLEEPPRADRAAYLEALEYRATTDPDEERQHFFESFVDQYHQTECMTCWTSFDDDCLCPEPPPLSEDEKIQEHIKTCLYFFEQDTPIQRMLDYE
jgi:hypothetical protein